MYVIFFRFIIICALVQIVLLASCNLLAQSKEDSLLGILPNAKDQERLLVYFELIKNTYERENQKAYDYSIVAYDLAESLGDSLMITKIGRAIGSLKIGFGHLDEAIEILNKHLLIARRNGFRDQEKFILNHIAIAYTHKSNYDKALDYNFQSLIIREKEGNKREISLSYLNIGLVYYKLGDIEQALEYSVRSLNLLKEVKTTVGMDRCLMNIGLCYVNLSRYEEAIKSINEGFSVSDEKAFPQIFIEGHFALGTAYGGMGYFSESIEHYQEAFVRAAKARNSRFMVESLLALGSVSGKLDSLDDSKKYLTKAERMLDTLDYGVLKTTLYKDFVEYYSSIGDIEQKALYQTKFIQLNDSLMNQELIKNLARIQTDYEERENIATIAIKDEALIRQKRFNVSIVIITLLAGLVVFVLYRSNLTKRKVNKALSEAKEIIENQNKQLTSLNKNLEKMVESRTYDLKGANEALKRVNDELDNFIYKTSHDIRGPLATLKGMCNVAIMDVKDPVALEYFSKLDVTAEKLNSILTRLLIINQINNSSARHELIEFNEIVDDVILLQRKRGLPPRLSIQREVEQGIVFYSDQGLVRIVLENLIDNAIKFFNDSERITPFVEIKVKKEASTLIISVLDNGIGIHQAKPDKIFQMFSRASERSDTGGIGLYLTKTAVEKIGGRIDLRTTSEGYTEFYVKFAITS